VSERRLVLRWLRFNAVGAAGIAVQLAALWTLKSALGIPYLWATTLAVETAVLHNFYWHERWTWADRRGSWTQSLARLLRFNLTTGALSIVSNVVLMRLLAGWLGLHYLAANLIAIAITSVANFLMSEFFVFATVAAVKREPAGVDGRLTGP
jgi:dolichol-phosphate mannosyltransferase